MVRYFRHALLIFSVLFSLQLHAALPLFDSQDKALPSLAPMIKQVRPAVVNVLVSSTQTVDNPLLNDPFFRHFFNIPKNYQQQRKSSSAGSGVIIDADEGIVITNNHVIANADEIQVGLSDGRTVKAELLGSDPEVDIAVLKIEADNLSEVRIADSDKLEVGDFVVAIGNPFGLGQTVTTGVISALERSGLGIEGYENFIQTDASINPGNSGGALVNLHGELVGINTAILAPSGGNIGIGFAIPINMAMGSHKQILKHGEVKRGRIGIFIQDLNSALAEAFGLDKDQQGVLITKVQEDSPAEKSGLEAEDIIIAVNDKTIRKAGELRNAIGMQRVGDTVEIRVLRNKKEKTIKVKIEQLDSDTSLSDNTELGKELQGADFQATDTGLQVVQIQPGSAASMSGLRGGDVIIAANRMAVKSLADLQQAMKKDSSKLLLQILRDNAVLFLVIRN